MTTIQSICERCSIPVADTIAAFSQRHIMVVSDDCTVEKELKVVFNSKEQAEGFRGMCFSWK